MKAIDRLVQVALFDCCFVRVTDHYGLGQVFVSIDHVYFVQKFVYV